MAAPKKADAGEGQVKRLSLTLSTDSELQEGLWERLPCGLEALLAPNNTQEFYRVMRAQILKFGGRDARDLSDVKGARQLDCLCAITARANFKAFRDPFSGKGEVEVNGELLKDDVKVRERLLLDFPSIREEVAEAVSSLSESYEDEMEEAGKN
jgi:hypothetical protein